MGNYEALRISSIGPASLPEHGLCLDSSTDRPNHLNGSGPFRSPNLFSTEAFLTQRPCLSETIHTAPMFCLVKPLRLAESKNVMLINQIC